MKQFIKSVKLYVCAMICCSMMVACGVSEEGTANEVLIEESPTEEVISKESLVEEYPIPSYFMQVDGAKYTLPFKVSELEKAGFDLSKYAEMMLEPAASEHFWLEKNELKYSFHVANQNDSDSNVMDCMVYSMGLDGMHYSMADAMILEGIVYGTDEATVKAVYETYGTRIDEVDDGRTIYRIAARENPGRYYRVDVKEGIGAAYFEVMNYDTSKMYSVEVLQAPVVETTPEPTVDDYVMEWNDEYLEAAMREVTGINDRDIMYSDVKDITELILDERGIGDIRALSSLTNLTKLSLYSNSISDISALSGLTQLTYLDLEGNETISDISALSGLVNLKELYLSANSISDVNALSGLNNLTVLTLSWNGIDDVSALSGLTNLTTLRLDYNFDISDISALSGMINLTKLYLGYNNISDISPLSNLTSLEFLWLEDNPITDYSAVSFVPDLQY